MVAARRCTWPDGGRHLRPGRRRRCSSPAVLAYKCTLSPLLGRHCRFQPTCSTYFRQAVEKYGAVRGTLRGARANRPLPSLASGRLRSAVTTSVARTPALAAGKSSAGQFRDAAAMRTARAAPPRSSIAAPRRRTGSRAGRPPAVPSARSSSAPIRTAMPVSSRHSRAAACRGRLVRLDLAAGKLVRGPRRRPRRGCRRPTSTRPSCTTTATAICHRRPGVVTPPASARGRAAGPASP